MKNTEKDERQYSKRVLTVMCNIWIAGAWIGCGMVMMPGPLTVSSVGKSVT